jgi:hypothetical protein
MAEAAGHLQSKIRSFASAPGVEDLFRRATFAPQEEEEEEERRKRRGRRRVYRQAMTTSR